MPFDGVFTHSILKEISSLINDRIDKVQQPTKDEIILTFKKNKQNIKLLLSCNPSFPRIHFTEQSRENPKTAPNFCMLLRKYLIGAKISEINQINFDRIIEIKLESKDELGYAAEYYLIIEIMGKHSNIILLNKDRIIVDSIKHIGSDISRYREVLPGVNYVNPPSNNKVDPLKINKDYFLSLVNNNMDITPVKLLCNSFFGVSKAFAEEISNKYSTLKIHELSENNIDSLYENFTNYVSKIKNGLFSYMICYLDGQMVDYYSFYLQKYSNYSLKYFDSPSKILDSYYGEKDVKNTLKQKFHDLFKLVNNLLERNSKKVQIYNLKIDECMNFETWKIYGDLIMANQYIINSNMEEVEVENFYDESLSKVTIPLEKDITPTQNAQKYYKKYAKEKSTIEIVNGQLNDSINEKDYLESTLYNIENANDVETIEEIKLELSELGYIKRKKRVSKGQKSTPMHYISSDNYDIYVGKNNHQNDYLTTKFAISSDIWMHTKNIPGSHVIIKSKDGKVSDTALLEGALLAAYNSKAKNSTNVPVDYTEKKNVKKPSGAKPGMVIYYTNKTIYTTPDKEKIQQSIKQITL